jgi:hypothetical protein
MAHLHVVPLVRRGPNPADAPSTTDGTPGAARRQYAQYQDPSRHGRRPATRPGCVIAPSPAFLYRLDERGRLVGHGVGEDSRERRLAGVSGFGPPGTDGG